MLCSFVNLSYAGIYPDPQGYNPPGFYPTPPNMYTAKRGH